jgi:hypothetical protein
VHTVVLPVASAAGLVPLKLHPGGPKDASDSRSLLEVADDRDALVAEAESLLPSQADGTRQLWSRLHEEA